MGVEEGETPSIRGIVKCLNCQWYQSFISYNKSTRVAVGPVRSSTCMKCGRRNRWTIQPDGKTHGNHLKYKCVNFIKRDSSTPRSKLVEEAKERNGFVKSANINFRQLKSQSKK